MRHIKLEYIVTLAKLLTKGAGREFIEATSTSIATEINKSQQAASKIILDLENLNFIERVKKGHGYRIHVTDEGLMAVKDVSSMLMTAVDFSTKSMMIEGTIVSGVGEGGYYMALDGYRKQFRTKLGYIPYPGTLNVKISGNPSIRNREKIEYMPYIFIKGFSDLKRTYGWVKCFPAIINDNSAIQAHLLLLERTHYDKTMVEMIAPEYLKGILRLANGDGIKILVRVKD
jgi:riboflavin kinase